ncbi:ABC transporter ATP-binding protein [Frigidibacter sp. ROC022]|uniref:ABC transporter ATP-binding protein n=1 Tax=Frigidibacter sp. ROC022 TaxID=2971796 RepID=UPI00215A52AF|nr:sn-glycerol-3-phosphate ABC transporter ATP-binding protein UgpC [Frigidibacter sp. ROC022]MCR8723739.1 sn-glycerol-3-phosphate ABC transporter ATP-binding protein UgpC [Frigidibacter sp. ROC022]
MAHVTVRGLRKAFGAVEVLHGLDIAIADGEFIAVLGESGCGKSTFLRIVAGLEDASSGEIEIDGREVTHLTPKERDIAMVFQTYALYPHMTVRENIEFPLEVLDLGKVERSRRSNEAAALLNLEPYLDRKPRDLSGGQRQRVAMARAIVREPKVFLFDEPLSNLDAKLRVQMRGEIRRLQQRLGVTAIYVTHDQVEALTMADRVMLLNAGRIEQFAPPLELYDRPASVFAAAFIGSPPMNLVDSEPVAAGTVKALGTSIAIPDNITRPVTLGFRPEHVEVLTEGPGQFSGRVDSAENTGDRLNISVEVGQDLINVSISDRRDIAPGDTVALSVAPERLHIFDRETGRRV